MNRFREYNKKLPFTYDTSSLFLPWIMMLMVFLATLCLAGTLVVENVTDRWKDVMSGSLTVQVMPFKDKITIADNVKANENVMQEVEKVVLFLQQIPEVEGVKVLSLPQLQKLLQPWLGDVLADSSFPLPQLIEIKVKAGESVDLEKLKVQLEKIAPNASLDMHKIWVSKLVGLASTLNATVLVILFLVLLTTSFAVVYATITSLEVHKNAIELLHLIGAKDRYIAVLFSYRTLLFSLAGAIIGAVLALPLLIIMGHFSSSLEIGALSDASLGGWNWMLVLLVPFIGAFVSGMTAFLTVSFKLRRVL